MARRNRTKRHRKTRRTRRQKGGSAAFTVQYGQTPVQGQELSIAQTQEKPSVVISLNHYLVMYDPDAVKPDWIHWIATAEGDVLPYQGPTPPPGTGVHRYILVLSAGSPPQAPKERGGQDVSKLIKSAKAKVFFTVSAPSA